MKPHERFDAWLEANAAQVEEMITYCSYDRAWAWNEIDGPIRRWVFNNTTKCANRTAWKRMIGTWLSKGWADRPKEETEERDFNRPPSV